VRADELMSSPVVTVTPEMSVKAAAGVLLDGNVIAAPVLDDVGALVGIVSETDLLAHRTPHDPRAHLRLLPDDPVPPPHAVRDVMTTNVITTPEHADAADTVTVMLERRVKSLPVLRDGRVVGMVSQRDLLRALARSDDDISTDVQHRLTEHLDAPAGYRVAVREGMVSVCGPNPERSAAVALVRTVPGVVRVIWRDVS
jgi:CBS domain-containing protein